MNNAKIQKMVGIALLMALVIVLQLLSGIIPPIAGFPISLVLIPIVLGGAIYGVQGGAILGAAFGMIVFINCVNGTDPGGAMVLQANPVLCLAVVMGKGILAGMASALAYRLVSGRNGYLAMLCGAIICPVVNTGTFIACMLLFYKNVLAIWAGGGDIIAYVLTGLVLAKYVPDLLINVVFSPAGYTIIRSMKKT